MGTILLLDLEDLDDPLGVDLDGHQFLGLVGLGLLVMMLLLDSVQGLVGKVVLLHDA